jgi:thioredoxin 1
MAVMHLDQNNFKAEVEQATLPVLVDFWAEWCGPCRMIAPIIEEIAGDLSEKLKVGKVNVDEAQDLAMRFEVMSIPTLILFKNGEPVDQIIGAMPKQNIIKKIEPYLT